MPKKSLALLLSVCCGLFLLLAGCEDKAKKDTSKPDAGTTSKPEQAKQPQQKKDRKREVMSPVVAGRFYPGDASELKSMIEAFLEKAEVPALSGRPLGFMVPHAGYPYSGPVAAHVYKAVQETDADKFVIMGPSHGVRFNGVYVMSKDAYKTPLGEVNLMREKARRLAEARPWISTDDRFYGREHSVEVQLPFLQKAAGPDLSVMVVVIGQADYEKVYDLARLLKKAFSGEEVVYLASTDMSHGNIPPYKSSKEIQPVDKHTLELIKSMDMKALEKGLRDRSTPMCGGLPVLALMKLYELSGGKEIKVLDYADSGDATGDHSRVVGYGAAAFMTSPDSSASQSSGPGFSLTREDKKKLMEIARRTVEAAIKGEEPPSFQVESKNLKQEGAAFVTLKTDGRLRGCIGSIVATEPLYKCVRRRAVDAALHDSRFVFNRLGPDELADLEIEISVLTPPRLVSDLREIKVGRDGVILSLDSKRGVFLPQVPVEQGWDRQAYLSNLCRKAGIRNRNCYQDPKARLRTFRAIVFSEDDLAKN